MSYTRFTPDNNDNIDAAEPERVPYKGALRPGRFTSMMHEGLSA